MTNLDVEMQIISRKQELNALFDKYGLNDFTLRKSQELDEFIVIAQRNKLLSSKDSTITCA